MPPAPPAFQAFGPVHLLTLAVLAAIGTTMIVSARRNQRLARLWEMSMAIALLTVWPGAVAIHLRSGTLTAETLLPLHYCDLAAITGAVALLTHRQLCCEIVYFFGLAGTLQGLLTPALTYDFPHLRFFHFFLLHGGVVITAIYVVTAMQHQPRPGAVGRMMALTLAYAVLVAGVNKLFGTNFGFLSSPPPTASLIDHLGKWPWYIGWMVILAMVFYALLYLPFLLRSLSRPKPPCHIGVNR